MLRAGALNLRVDPVRMKMTVTQHIMIFQVCDSDESKSKDIIAEEKSFQVCSMEERESESVIVD